MKKRIYLDHAATTYLDPRVKTAMDSYWIKNFGNPSSIYEEGRAVKTALASARNKVAEILSARPDEIVFTNGGTESDNLAVLGVARKQKALRQAQGKLHIITSKIEHHAVLHSCEKLKQEGFEISYIDVDKNGVIDLKQLKAELRPPARHTAQGAVGGETILVSVMYANNEIGTIQPIKEIAKIVHRNSKAIFHTDAVQAPAYLDLNVLKLGVDLMTLNGSKIYGPKGIGVLFKKRGIKLEPLIYGGHQESGLRPGTENVPAIIGFARALELVQKDREKESKRLIKLRVYFMKELFKTVPTLIVNGSLDDRLPNNINISIYGVEGEAMVLYLDEKGVACSTGSACTSDNLDPSHVIMALGVSYEYAHGSLRFTMGKQTTKSDIDYVLEVLPDIIKKLRNISALK
ncbi:cysteine desulfurase family protein [Patescibacteria group bacterium]